jgi:hypothetical protein
VLADVFEQIRPRDVREAVEMMSLDNEYNLDEEEEEEEETDEEGELLEMEDEEDLDKSDRLEEVKYEKQLWSNNTC